MILNPQPYSCMLQPPVLSDRYVRTHGHRRYVVEYRPSLNAWVWWAFEVDPHSGIDLRRVRSECGMFSAPEFEAVIEHANEEIDYQQTLPRNEVLGKPPTDWRKTAAKSEGSRL